MASKEDCPYCNTTNPPPEELIKDDFDVLCEKCRKEITGEWDN